MSADATLDARLRHAIAGRRLVGFIYKRESRVVEPHDYGRLKGRVRLLGYQVGGGSQGPLPGWRMFDVDGITGLAALERTFPGSRNRAGQAHKDWDELFSRVS